MPFVTRNLMNQIYLNMASLVGGYAPSAPLYVLVLLHAPRPESLKARIIEVTREHHDAINPPKIPDEGAASGFLCPTLGKGSTERERGRGKTNHIQRVRKATRQSVL